jgi:glycerol uptake facilitator
MLEAPAVAELRAQRLRDLEPPPPSLWRCCLAEFLGTFILVLFGCGVVHATVLAKAHTGLFQVAIVWGIAVALAIHATGSISGGHINPAMTAALAVFGGFPKRRVLPYFLAQLAGAFAAASILYLCFGGLIAAAEAASGVARGSSGSEVTAMCYGEYFPNPGLGVDAAAHAKVSELTAFVAEFVGTAMLAFVVFALTEKRNASAPGGALAPLLIGLTVAALISVIAPLTQACFNPARDFGPRLFTWFAGWGSVAIPGPRGGFFTVYILAPITGALLGAAVYRLTVHPGYRTNP